VEQQKPSVGRVVHYVSYGTPGGEFPAGVCRAAIITELDVYGDGRAGVGLCVLNPSGQFFNRAVPRDEETKKPGTWHFPERI
jgi:hypothetical protein